MSKQQHHYYATSGYGWGVGPTREAAIKKALAWVSKPAMKRGGVDGPGVAFSIARIELPEQAHYTIMNYLPHTIQKEDGKNEARKGERVPMTEREEVRVTDFKGTTIPNPAFED